MKFNQCLFPLEPSSLWKTLTLESPQTSSAKLWDLGDLWAGGHIWGREAVGRLSALKKKRQFRCTSVMCWASVSHDDKTSWIPTSAWYLFYSAAAALQTMPALLRRALVGYGPHRKTQTITTLSWALDVMKLQGRHHWNKMLLRKEANDSHIHTCKSGSALN